MPATVVCDIDGTLVDTNYQHALAWFRAFRQHEVVVPIWRIHRTIGMGGDKLVAALAGDEVEDEKGDDIREAEAPLYMAMIEEVEAFEGASELLAELAEIGHPVVLSSSAKAKEVEHYLDLLDARELVAGWITSGDVEETKPDPELVETALAKADGEGGVMLGDSVWDVKAAKRAGIPTVAVLTGGYSEDELRDAGSVEVFESIGKLRERPEALGAASK
ncbi:MAG: HAD family hydrolase [Solirubrobacterales bacterium]|nr:HAD family hydrolase [Solirubrobacterales bacterium]